MTAPLPDPRLSLPMTARSARLRERIAGLERPLLLAGLALVALHLLDLAFSGPAPSLVGVLAIVAVPVAWVPARPHVTWPTRLVLGLGAPEEIPANRAYRVAGGPTTQLWELPDTGHTGGLRTHPAAYDQRISAFLDQALDLKETS